MFCNGGDGCHSYRRLGKRNLFSHLDLMIWTSSDFATGVGVQVFPKHNMVARDDNHVRAS